MNLAVVRRLVSAKTECRHPCNSPVRFGERNARAQSASEQTAAPAAISGRRRAGQDAIRVREASFDDHQQVVMLQSRYGLQSKSYDEWRRLWSENPARKRLGLTLPIGWVLEDTERQVVGYMASIPLLYHLDGEMLLAAAGHSWVVDSRHRLQSLSLLLRFFAQPEVDLFLNTTANAVAGTAFLKLRGARVPVGCWDRCAYWIVDHQAAARSYLRHARLPAAGILSYPIGVVSAARDLFRKALKTTPARGIDVEFHREFDKRFDSFWESLRVAGRRLLLADRSRETLQWHFRDALSAGQVWIMSASRGATMLGYAIFGLNWNAEIGFRRLRLIDFQALERPRDVLASILACAYERCRSSDIHVIESAGTGIPKTELFEQCGHSRRLAAWSHFYRPGRTSLSERFRDPAIWDPSLFDGDASL
jgi:hypothetical protein